MSDYFIKKGLDLPLTGFPAPDIIQAPMPELAALVGDDYTGISPRFLVKPKDKVKAGQPLFIDKKREGVLYTSPLSGTVRMLKRGEKRKFIHISIEPDGKESELYPSYSMENIKKLDREFAENLLIESGFWTALKERPYGRAPLPKTTPSAIFVNLADNSPLAPNVNIVLDGKGDFFNAGLIILSKFAPVHLCISPDCNLQINDIENLQIHTFKGKFPSGLTGTHVHMVHPVSRNRKVWMAGAQSVSAIGKLFLAGEADFTKVISLAGPGVANPVHIRTVCGAQIKSFTENKLIDGENRIISGNIFCGREVDESGFIGRFHNTVTVIPEGRERRFMGWATPSPGIFSIKNIFISRFLGGKYKFNTSTNGSLRPILPIETYEQVMPFDIHATHLLKALAVEDLELAEKLGALELLEEDMGLMNYVCPGKVDHAKNLRKVLNAIEKES